MNNAKSMLDNLPTSSYLSDEQIAQIKADLENWFEENKVLFKGDTGATGPKGENGATADTSRIDSLENAIESLTNRIATVENMLNANGTVGQKLAELETMLGNKANATDLTTLETTVNNFKGNYTSLASAIEGLNLSQYLKIADHTNSNGTNANNGYTKNEIDSKIETIDNRFTSLENRVTNLETVILAENGLVVTINTLKATVGNNNSGLVKDLNDLKDTVTENATKLVYKIGSEEFDIKVLANRVANLESVKDAYKEYCDSAVSGLAKMVDVNAKLNDYAKTSDLTDYAKKTEVVGLVTEFVNGQIATVTNELENYVTSSSLTTTLADYIKSSEVDITNITSRLSNLESAKVTEVVNIYAKSDGYFCANAYIKLADDCYIGYERVEMDVATQNNPNYSCTFSQVTEKVGSTSLALFKVARTNGQQD